MKRLILSPENEQELTFLKQLLEKMGVKAEELTEEDIEELGLLRAMEEGKKGDYIEENEIRKTLNSK
jgi:hypothetical protein